VEEDNEWCCCRARQHWKGGERARERDKGCNNRGGVGCNVASPGILGSLVLQARGQPSQLGLDTLSQRTLPVIRVCARREQGGRRRVRAVLSCGSLARVHSSLGRVRQLAIACGHFQTLACTKTATKATASATCTSKAKQSSLGCSFACKQRVLSLQVGWPATNESADSQRKCV
jgi:hypothetical protein